MDIKKSILLLAIFAWSSFGHAAGFDCSKASIPVEKSICSDSRLSELDDLLIKAYKKAMANATASEMDVLKSQQRAWLANVRNKCQDSVCLVQVYNERLTSLNSATASDTSTEGLKDVVMGRCHMLVCWWWKVEKTENIQSDNNGNLLKVYTRTTSQEYSDSEYNKHGYPDFPPKKSKWEGVHESFVFCSKKLPTYIEYNAENKKFTGTVPFDQKGVPSGATEGIGNLYYYVCNGGKESEFDISPELEYSGMVLDKPTDIFNYIK